MSSTFPDPISPGLETPPGRGSRLVRNLVLGLIGLIGMVLGASCGYFGAPYLRDLRWSDLLALAVSVAFLVGGALMLFAAASPARLARALKVELCSARDQADMRRQAAVMLLAGVMMAIPVASARFGDPNPWASWMFILGLFVLQTALNLLIWRRGDELTRRTITETGAAAFWLGQGALFLYAAAERLQLTAPLTAFDLVVMLMSLFLVTNVVVSVRRGLA